MQLTRVSLARSLFQQIAFGISHLATEYLNAIQQPPNAQTTSVA
jgi:hypothetical protein